MTAFKRLSAAPTVPDLLRREAERRAVKHCRALPAAAWCRTATIAVAWDHSLNGSLFRPGPARQAGSEAMPPFRPAAVQASLPAPALRSWQCQAGMAACFAGASGLLAAARLLNWCRLLSPDGIAAALAGADRLTRAGMRLWRSSRASRRT